MFLRELFETEFQEKARYKSEGKKVMEWVENVIINSTYGFFGLRSKDRDGVDVFYKNDNSYFEQIEKDKVRNILQTKKYTLIRSERDLNVSVAAAITLYSRMKHYMAIRNIENKKYKQSINKHEWSINKH